MTAKLKARDDLSALRTEAGKVMEELTHFGRVLSEVGEAKSHEVKGQIESFTKTEIESLRERLARLNAKVKEHARQADTHIHSRPYSYIAGALGLGFLVGKISRMRGSRSEEK